MRRLFNTMRILPYRIYDIADILEESFGRPRREEDTRHAQMYVLTNSEKYWGAVSIIYGGVLEKIAEKIGKDYFVLPSSIHECMIVPEADAAEKRRAASDGSGDKQKLRSTGGYSGRQYLSLQYGKKGAGACIRRRRSVKFF